MKLEEKLLALRDRWDYFTVAPTSDGMFEITNDGFEGYNPVFRVWAREKTIEAAIDAVTKILNCKHPNVENRAHDETYYYYVCYDCGYQWSGPIWQNDEISMPDNPKTLTEAFQRGIFKEKEK